MELHVTIALTFDYLHVEFQTTGCPSLSALVDKLLHLPDSATHKKIGIQLICVQILLLTI